MNNRVKLELEAKKENVSIARVVVSQFVSLIDITVDELMDIKTAVSEAVTNSIEHGYENKAGIVMLDISMEQINSIHRLRVQVIDNGVGIDDIDLAMEAAYTSKPELEHAGLGFTIMQTFMDEVIVESEPNVITKITLIKDIKKIKSE